MQLSDSCVTLPEQWKLINPPGLPYSAAAAKSSQSLPRSIPEQDGQTVRAYLRRPAALDGQSIGRAAGTPDWPPSIHGARPEADRDSASSTDRSSDCASPQTSFRAVRRVSGQLSHILPALRSTGHTIGRAVRPYRPAIFLSTSSIPSPRNSHLCVSEVSSQTTHALKSRVSRHRLKLYRVSHSGAIRISAS